MDYLNSLEKRRAAVVLRKCLPSSVWVEAMILRRPFASADAAASAARAVAEELRPCEWMEVFSGEDVEDPRCLTEAAAAELKSECIERCVAALRRVDGVVDSRMDHHVDLAWDPAPAKKSLVGGLDYHQTLTDKVTVTESAVRVRHATAMRQPEIEAEIENKKLPRFFGGAWR